MPGSVCPPLLLLTAGELTLGDSGLTEAALAPCGIKRQGRRRRIRPTRPTIDLCSLLAEPHAQAECGPPGPECATDAKPIKLKRFDRRDKSESWSSHLPTVKAGVVRVEPARTGSHVPAAYVPATKVVVKRGKRVEVPDNDAPPDRWAPLPEPPEPGSITTFGRMESVDPIEERTVAAAWALTVTQAGMVDLFNQCRKRGEVKPWTVWECAGAGGERLEFGPAEVFQLWRSVAQSGQPPPGMNRQIAIRARMILESMRLISRDRWAKRWWLHRPEHLAPERLPSESVYVAIKRGSKALKSKHGPGLMPTRMAVRKLLWSHIRRHPESREAVLATVDTDSPPVLVGAAPWMQEKLDRLWRSWRQMELMAGEDVKPNAPWSKPPRPPRPDRKLPQAELFGGKSCIGGRAKGRRQGPAETTEEDAEAH